jgi:cysteinyl-tRNA synthetase
MRFHNTLTKSVEPFVPLEAGRVRMYNCGPTVYDSPHVGNFRTFAFADTLRRYLEYRGLQVTQVMNLTDVGHLTQDQVEAGGDKMEEGLRRLREKGVNVTDPYQVAEHYIGEFHAARKALNFLDAHHYPRATAHVPEMIEMIGKLLEKGAAYRVGGNVYFEVSKFPAYGKLSGNTLESIKSGARIELNPEKRHPADFALWKTDPNHLMQFDAPWGRGFPGWHIECSAMSRKYLGDTFDIHTGGEDNIFPHHECEIAQSEAFTGHPFVKVWIHARHLLWDEKKMSKSEGTFFSIQDLLDRGYPGEAIRYALVTTHYRQQVNYTMKSFDDAKASVARLREFHARVAGDTPGADHEIVAASRIKFAEAMDDDLNTSGAIGVVHDFVREANRNLDAGKAVPGAKSAIEGFLTVFGIPLSASAEIPADVAALVRSREDARKRRDWAESDRLRDEIQKRGWIVKDTKDGSQLRKL